jgi:hypothetical protein
MAGLDPAIHPLLQRWIAGSRRWRGGPAMTNGFDRAGFVQSYTVST